MKVKENKKQLIKRKGELEAELLEVRSKKMIIGDDVFEKKIGEILLQFIDSISINSSLFFDKNTFEELLKLHRQSIDDVLMEELKRQNGGK